MIAEAAYYLAEKRGFQGKHALDDWLAAEQQVHLNISAKAVGEAAQNPPPSRYEKLAANMADRR